MTTLAQLGSLPPALADALAGRSDLQLVDAGPSSPTTRLAVLSRQHTLDAAALATLPALEAVFAFGVGVDHVDLAAVAERGVVLSNTPDVLTDCVADLAVGACIALRRGLLAADGFVRSGRWAAGESTPLGHRVTGSRVGVLGHGRIGRAVARRLAAFDCPIGHYRRPDGSPGPGRPFDSVVELAAWSDVLVVTVAGGPATRHLVDASVLDALGPEGALVASLTDGRLGGAALDTFAHEPDVPPGLLGLPHVVLLPHIGSATHETRRDMAALVLANIDAWVAHRSLVTPVGLP